MLFLRQAPHYLGETELADTPEEALIVKESEESVAEAKAKFALIEKEVVDHHVLKQIANKLLHIQEDMIQHFKEEGILYPIDAELLISETEEQKRILLRDFKLIYLNMRSDEETARRSVHAGRNVSS